MSNIDKQSVQAVADLKAGYTLGHADVAILNEVARIALASLEAEAVCVIDQPNLDYLKSGADADVWPASRTEMGDVLLYRASPPAPANAEPVAWLWSHRKHPSEVTLVRPEDDERAEGAHWSGWSCQALYEAPPAPVSVPDEIPKLKDGRGFRYVKDGVHYSVNYANGWNQCRAAMLQGAEPVTTDYKLPDDFDFDRFNDVVWLEAVASNPQMHSPTTSTIAMVALELNRKLSVGNSPVIPDGWVLVPEEPNHEMLEAGDEQFGTYDVYRRMIAAAPQQEVKP